MSKFNETVKRGKTVTTNYMGEKAYKDTPKEEIVGILLTSFLENSYYEKAKNTLDRFVDALRESKDKLFAAKAAIFARNEFGMRSVTHVTAAEIAHMVKGEEWTKRFIDQVVHRVDDITEILAYYLLAYGKPIPNALKKGLGIAFSKFDKYQIAKYRKENAELSLVDVVNLVHPKPVQKNKEALKELVAGNLKSLDTWEAKHTRAGQVAKTEEEKKQLKADNWKELLDGNKLGYFAALRNIRNILEQYPQGTGKLKDILLNKKMLKKSLVLPFRFVSAYKAVEEMTSTSIAFESDKIDKNGMLKVIEQAIELSIENIPQLDGRTMILSDNSGSMGGDSGGSSFISACSKVTTAQIANLFALMYWTKANDTFVGAFGDKLIEPDLSRDAGLFTNYRAFDNMTGRCGGSTEEGIYIAFEKLIKDKIMVDRIVVFSDCQIGDGATWYDTKDRSGWGSFQKLYNEYRKINPNFRIYSIDLKGYGTTVFTKDVIKLSGWSEKIFSIMRIAEQDKKALVHKIESIEI